MMMMVKCWYIGIVKGLLANCNYRRDIKGCAKAKKPHNTKRKKRKEKEMLEQKRGIALRPRGLH